MPYVTACVPFSYFVKRLKEKKKKKIIYPPHIYLPTRLETCYGLI